MDLGFLTEETAEMDEPDLDVGFRIGADFVADSWPSSSPWRGEV
jgi:hypothetical protein